MLARKMKSAASLSVTLEQLRGGRYEGSNLLLFSNLLTSYVNADRANSRIIRGMEQTNSWVAGLLVAAVISLVCATILQ